MSFHKTLAGFSQSAEPAFNIKSSKQMCSTRDVASAVVKAKSLETPLELDSQHITEPLIEKEIPCDVGQIIKELLSSVNREISILNEASHLAIKQTIGSLLNDPHMIIFDSGNLISEHKHSKLSCDQEPQPKAYIDGSIGCVNIQHEDKKHFLQSDFSINVKLNGKGKTAGKTGQLGFLQPIRKQVKNKTLNFLNLPLIDERKSSFSNSKKSITSSIGEPNEDIISQAKLEKLKIDFKKIFKSNQRRSQSGDMFNITGAVNQLAKFTTIDTKKQDKDDVDHFINFLRYVKGDKESTGANVLSFILDSFKPKETSKQGTSKRASVKNIKSTSKPEIVGEGQWLQGPMNKLEKTKNEEIKFTKNLASKKTNMMNYQSCISVVKDKYTIGKITQTCQQKVIIKSQSKHEAKANSKEEKQNNEPNKRQSSSLHISQLDRRKKSLLESNDPRRTEKQKIQLPSLYQKRNSKQFFHPIYADESLVWLKGKQDQKEYEQKVNQFLSSHSEKCSVRVNNRKNIQDSNQNKDNVDMKNLQRHSRHARNSRVNRQSLALK